MAGLRDLIQSYAYGGPVRRYAAGDVVTSASQPAFSSDKTINDAWNALAGKTGADITAQRQALANQNSVYQTNQNLGNMYGITEAPAQKQFLTDYNAATSNPNFHYTGEATAHPDLPYQLNPSEALIKSLIAANTANPGKGSGNAIMNQFVGDPSAVGNPFLGEYKWGTTPGLGVQKDANGNPLQGIVSYTNKELTDIRNGAIPNYTTAAQSKNNVGDVFLTKNGIVSQETDSNGYTHIVSGGNEYLINPTSKRIISITPIKHASGGSVGMPDSYSRGNWKLI